MCASHVMNGAWAAVTASYVTPVSQSDTQCVNVRFVNKHSLSIHPFVYNTGTLLAEESQLNLVTGCE